MDSRGDWVKWVNKSEFYRRIFTLFYLTNEVMKMNPIAFDSNSLPEEIKIAKNAKQLYGKEVGEL